MSDRMLETTYQVAPGARHIERLEDETLVYDVSTDIVLRLDADATSVWDACTVAPDGGATVATIEAITGLGTARVDQALAELADGGLIEAIGPDGISRRQFGRKVAIGAAAVAGLALVTSMAAPTPAMAASDQGPGGGGGQSGGGDDCTTDCG